MQIEVESGPVVMAQPDAGGSKIVVVGAGAAGLACAISAAMQGGPVTLVEKTAHLGGTVVHSLIHTIGGLYDDAGDYLNEGLPIEMAELLLQADSHTRKRKMGKVWTLSVDPAVYAAVIERWISDQPNLEVLRNTHLRHVQTKGNRVKQIEVTNGGEIFCLDVDVLVDTTGTAAVVRMVDPSKVIEGDALAGLIFQICGTAPEALKFPKNVGVQRYVQKAISKGLLPAVFTNTWFDAGVHDHEVYAKLNLPATAYDVEAVPVWQVQLLQFLRQMPDFSNAYVKRVGQLGIRDGGRIKGQYCLTLEDVKCGRTFADAVGRCAWPIEYWDPERGITLDDLPPHHCYDIPLRSLHVLGMENLWAAGKCLSAEKLAQASARVAGTCWAMGDALGKAIACPI